MRNKVFSLFVLFSFGIFVSSSVYCAHIHSFFGTEEEIMNVIVTGDMNGELIVWKNQNGTFEKIFNDTLPGRVKNIEIGDVNADGNNEILVSADILEDEWWRGGVYYLYQSTLGGIQRTWNVTDDDCGTGRAFAIGDADNDGTNDNFVAVEPICYRWRIYKHQSGTYESIFQDTIYDAVYVARIGDADNDGENEVLMGLPGKNKIKVYDNQSGTFVNTHDIPAESNVDNLRIGDLDQDGENEIVACGYFNFVSVFEHQSGEYVNVWNSQDMGNVFQDCAIGDINNNGKNDIVGFLYNSPSNPSKTIVWEHDGNTYVNIFNVTHDGPHLGMHVGSIGDADNDGENEWTVQEGDNISLWKYVNGTSIKVWEHATGGNPVSRIGDLSAQFYRLTIISEHGNTEGEGFYTVGSDATISANSPVNVEEGVRYVFTHWTGDYSSDEIIVNIPMNMSKTITANWKKQYYLTVNSSFGSPQGEGWYDTNSTAAFSVSPPDGFVIRHWFKHWAGDSTSSSQNSTIYMDGAKIVRAIWETDYSQLILILGISGFVGSLFVVIVYRRKRLQQG